MNRLIPIAVAALIIVAGGVYWLSKNSANSPTNGASSAETSAGEEVSESAGGIVEMVLGDADAPVTVIEYASFTCPHCASFHTGTFAQIKKDYVDTGKVRFVFREVYFDRYGLWASMVARCGGEERFFGITDMLFQSQRQWARGDDPVFVVKELSKIGRVAGLSQDELQACLDDGDNQRALVEWYQANGERDGVRSTPSFLIDGTMHSNMGYDEFKTILDAQLDG